MLVLSMVTAASPMAAAGDGSTQTVETLENGENLYLAFGADLGDTTLEEYVQTYASADANAETNADVIQYQDVDQVNIHERGEAVSIAIGGGEATAIREVNQQNTNSQVGEATAENRAAGDRETTFEEVGDVYLIMGDGEDTSFDGWGIAEDGDVSVTQQAEAAVTQTQSVAQSNVVQNTTALAFAEDESEATAIQLTEQSNLNLQEGSANATNVFVGDDGAQKKKHAKHGTLPNAYQAANATVEQAQEVQQLNADEAGSAVAIAVGENATATAVQIVDQSNLNEQIGTAEAINALMEATGMNVATASIDGDTGVVTQDGEMRYDEKKDPKKDGGGDVTQVAEATVTQYQSVEQVNVNLNASAQAIATNASTADAVQLTFQENRNAQIASADALNVFLEEGEHDKEIHKKYGDRLENGDDFEGFVLTNTTTATIDGATLADAGSVTVDYDGNADQQNDVEQYSTAEIEQTQEIAQANQRSSTALAIAEDDGAASAVQVVMQENENVQSSVSESTAVDEGPVDGETDLDGKKTNDEKTTKNDDSDGEKTTDDGKQKDDGKQESAETHSSGNGDSATNAGAQSADTDSADDAGTTTDVASTSEDDTEPDEMPGFGVAVALVAISVASMLAVRRRA